MWKCPKCGQEMDPSQKDAHMQSAHPEQGGNEGGQSESAA